MGSQGKGDADRHPLRDVVQCYGQYQEGGAAAGGFALFAVEGFRCEVGEQIVHGQKENDAEDRSTSGGQPTGHSHGLRLLNGWDEQGPHAGGNHHASGKSK